MKTRKSVTLSKLIKLERLEIKLESEKDFAEYEKSVFEGRTCSKIQKYLKCIRKTPSIPPTVNFDKTVASINVEKANASRRSSVNLICSLDMNQITQLTKHS